MKRYGWCIVVLSVVPAAGGCNRRQVRECTALVERINAADAAIQKGGGTGNRTQRVANMAKTIESERSAIAALAIKDAKLRGLRDDYATLLDEIARSSNKVLEAAHDNDSAAIQTSTTAIQAAGAKEAALLRSLNAYCQTAGG